MSKNENTIKRPTCKTCPYWNATQDDTEDRPSDEEIEQNDYKFDCRNHSPVSTIIERDNDRKPPDHGVSHITIWPTTSSWMWCGEHPDFPDFIASLKT